MKRLVLLSTVLLVVLGIVFFLQHKRVPNADKDVIVERTRTSIRRIGANGKVSLTASVLPMHFKNSQGQWVAYDTTLVPSKKEGYDYEVKSADHEVFFSKDPTKKGFLQLTREKQTLQYSLGQLLIEDKTDKKTISTPLRIDAFVEGNTITYKNIYGPGIDLRFKVDNTRIAKELIVKDRNSLPYLSDESSLSFSLSLTTPEGLDLFSNDNLLLDKTQPLTIDAPVKLADINPSKNDRTYDGKINRDDNTVFAILPAVAFDNSQSRNIISSSSLNTDSQAEISYTLTSEKNELVSKIEVSSTWLNIAMYPITIDPTIDLQVGAAADDGMEDGGSWTSDPTLLFVGGNSADYAAMRFTNVTVPQGSTIDSANLEVRSVQDQWISMAFIIYGDDADDSAAFSGGDPPSGRTLTTASVSHSSNAQWLAGNWYDLDEINTVVEEIVGRVGWSSGNAMSFILQGNGGEFGRKFIAEYDDDAASASQLHITYTASATDTPTNTPTPTDTPTPTPTFTPTPTPGPGVRIKGGTRIEGGARIK